MGETDGKQSIAVELDSSTTPKSSEHERVEFSDSKLKKCQECSLQQALYVCPRCAFRSCSLACCLAHKKRTQCNGKRIIATNGNHFLPLSRMTDGTLHEDYHFLEHVLQTVESNQRKRPPSLLGGNNNNNNNNRKRTRHNNNNNNNNNNAQTNQDSEESPPSEPCHPLLQQREPSGEGSPVKPWNGGGRHSKFKAIQRLANFPNRRVDVMFMSPGMQRPLHNKSHVKKQTIFWTVECFVHGANDATSERKQLDTTRKEDVPRQGCTEYKFLTLLSEECQLQEALLQLIEQRQKQLRKLNSRDPTIDALLFSMCKTRDPVESDDKDKDNLQQSQGYQLLLHQPRSRNYRPVMALATSLREALQDAHLLEFPTFHWVPKHLCTQERFPRLGIDVVDSTTTATATEISTET